MIKVDDIKKIMKLVLISSFLKYEKPLSLLLLGDTGTGKTEIIRKFSSERLLFCTDVSYSGLIEELKRNNSARHILIPDFIKITMKRRSTTDNLISLLNALVEEGLRTVIVGHNNKFDFNGRNLGLITATTRASYGQHREEWESFGFLDRMIKVSYSYSQQTIDEIFEYINRELYIEDEKTEKLRGYKDIGVESSFEFNKQLNGFSNNRFRTLKQLQLLIKCHALLMRRKAVIQEDVIEIIRLEKFMNFNYTKL